MPRVIDATTWEQWDPELHRTGRVRAHVFEWTDGRPVSPDPAIDAAPDVPDEWWTHLRSAHDAIAESAYAPGPGRRERHFTRRVAPHLPGARFPEETWVPQHCDFHWANLLAPRLTLVDWEGFALAPKGLDAATLLVYSLAHAPTAARVRDTFADVLAGDQGRSVQVYACVDVMTGVEAGFHPHLGPLIEEHLRALTRSRDTG